MTQHLDPQAVRQLLSVAHQHAVSHKFGAAVSLLKKAAKLLPLDAHVQCCLAGMCLRTGEFAKAV